MLGITTWDYKANVKRWRFFLYLHMFMVGLFNVKYDTQVDGEYVYDYKVSLCFTYSGVKIKKLHYSVHSFIWNHAKR